MDAALADIGSDMVYMMILFCFQQGRTNNSVVYVGHRQPQTKAKVRDCILQFRVVVSGGYSYKYNAVFSVLISQLWFTQSFSFMLI